ncbi:MAG: hypothetical protein KJ666_08625 [Bacteroidetes bacterium]|nr:hypothetical protein [Bacteroidota bacterium]
MDFVKFYIVQVLKNATSRLRLTDREKEKLVSRLTSRLENSSDIFPELKTMERVKGLEEAARRLLTIYRRLNKAHIDLERVSYQFSDDRDALTSTLRRFLQGKQGTTLNIDKSSRPKIVFDDATLTFYELKEPPKKEEVIDSKEELSEEDKLELHEFLERDIEPFVGVKENIELINEKSPEKIEKIDTDVSLADGTKAESISKPAEDENLQHELIRSGDEGASQTDLIQKVSEPQDAGLELSLFESDQPDQESLNLKSESGDKQISEEIKSEEIDERKDEPTTQKEFILKEELSDREGTFHREVKSHTNQHPKTEEELFFEFETNLLENIKELDDYLGKISTSTYNEKREEELITQAYKSLTTAEGLGHEVIAKMIRTYWAALLAIRDKKLAATKNEAELIRSTLIIIVALIKDKDIELEPYWENHNYLVNKLTDLSYEV